MPLKYKMQEKCIVNDGILFVGLVCCTFVLILNFYYFLHNQFFLLLSVLRCNDVFSHYVAEGHMGWSG